MLAFVLTLLVSAPATAPDTIVFCPTEFQAALQPWLQYRRGQGHVVEVAACGITADAARQRIREVAKGGRLRFVMLVGDADPSFGADPAWAARTFPVHRDTAKVNVLWGSPPHIASDNWYADLDDDQLPDVAIGRLTSDNPQELAMMVRKIIAYEQSVDFSPWRRQVNLIAGVGGFGMLADMALESATRYFVTRGIPQSYKTTMTYASWRSPYCPEPNAFRQATLDRLCEGSLLWVYIGHGYHVGLDEVQTPAGSYPILTAADLARLQSPHPPPIALFLACYAGALDATEDCLAECMLREPQGPIAVLAGSRVTMPYAMGVMANELSEACFRKHVATLGEAVLTTKRAMVKEPTSSNDARAMLDVLARALSPQPDKLALERAEHVQLFNLFGDPLLSIRYPRNIELIVPDEAAAGGQLLVRANSPVAGRCRVELTVPPGVLTFKPPSRSEYPTSPEMLREFTDVYQRANDDRLQAVDLTAPVGRFDAQVPVPNHFTGTCYVRIYIEGERDFAAGFSELKITTGEGSRQ